MRNVIIIWISILLSLTSSNAQIFNVKSYGIEEGIVQSQVSVIYQDHFGLLWLGTGGGVSRFNGVEFEDFTTKEGLVNNRVMDIHEDEHNRMWIATHEGLTIYNNRNTHDFYSEDIKNDIVELNIDKGLPGIRISCVESDGFGNLMIGTHKGLFIVDNHKNLWDSLKSSNKINGVVLSDLQGLPSSKITKIFVDKRRITWVGTNKGLARYDSKTGAITHIQGEGLNDLIRDICEDKYGNIWVSTIRGIVKIINPNNYENGVKVSYKTSFSERTCGDTRFVFVDSRNVVWTNCGSAVEIINHNNIGRDIDLETAIAKQFNGAQSTVRTAFEDREGNLWLGTNGMGVVRFSGRQFETYQKDHGLAGVSVRAISEDSEGKIWIGTNLWVSIIEGDRGEHIENGGQVDIQTLSRKEGGLNASSVWSLFNDSRGWNWVGTARGLWLSTGKNKYFFKATDGLGDNVVLSMAEDKMGNMYFGTFGGLSYIDYEKLESGKFEFINYTQDDGLSDDQINSLHFDQSNNLWIGTRNGLTQYNGQFTVFDENSGLKSAFIHSIAENVDGDLWIATGKGISHFDGLQFFNYSTKDGLSSDTPYLLEFDDYGSLWVGTNKGLDKLVFDSNDTLLSVKNYGALEGFIGVETNSNAVVKDRYGDLWFGTIKGVVKLNLDYERINLTKPLTHINSIKINLKDTALVDSLSLSYNQNNVTFEFSAISLTVPEKIKYRYQLVGSDEEPVEAIKMNYITYSNLLPGEYEFKVWACNNDGIWSTEPSTVKFVIHPPYWKTVWFYVLLAITGASLFYLFLQWRTNVLKKKQKELMDLVEDRTRQLKLQNEKVEEAFKEIENHRDEISEKNKDITASIRYAKHLQDVMLPAEIKMKEMLGEHFVINMPKDIVSGDFYWLNVVDNKILFSVIDCTGHGVPGAFMSIVSNGLLNRATNEFQLNSPDEILNLVNELSQISNQNKGEQFSNDGMDIALIAVDENKMLTYSGAYNPCVVVKNGELILLKPDKIPIGMHQETYQSYTSKSIQLEKGDMIYMFSDGFSDQFGGPEGKKMKSRRFREQLQKIYSFPVHEQRNYLLEFFINWKRHYDQLDDVMVIGIRVE